MTVALLIVTGTILGVIPPGLTLSYKTQGLGFATLLSPLSHSFQVCK